MLIITFKQSKSKNFTEVLKLSRKLSAFDESTYTIKVSKRDIYLKWDTLNLIFHYTLCWKGTEFNYKNITISSYRDMKRIFYEIQRLHSEFINFIAGRIIMEYRESPNIIEQYKTYGEIYTDKINLEKLTDDEINELIERMRKIK